jgi:hypothetical protein
MAVAAASPAEAEAMAGPPLILIGVSGLTWDDVSEQETPALWRAMSQGADVAGTITRSARVGSCPAEGWLALGAGQAAGEVAGGAMSDMKTVDPASCAGLVEPTGQMIPDWDQLTAAAVGRQVPLGSLAAWLRQAQADGPDRTDASPEKVAAGPAIGAIGPGAALALARSDGSFAVPYQPAPRAPEAWGEAVATAVSSGLDGVVVDAGTISPTLSPAQLDARLAAIWRALLDDSAQRGGVPVIILATLSAPEPAWGVTLRWGANPEPSPRRIDLIRSATTQTDGLVSSWDLTAVFESGLPGGAGVVPDPWHLAGDGLDVAEVTASLRDASHHAQVQRSSSQFAWAASMVIALAAVAAALLAGISRPGQPARLRIICLVALTAGIFPAAGFAANLLPWWRSAWPLGTWLALSVAIAGGIGLLVRALCVNLNWPVLRAPLAPAGLAGLFACLILLADPIFDGRIVQDAPLGYPTLLGARFTGYPNTVFAIVLVGALLAAALAASGLVARGWRRAELAFLGLVGCGMVAAIGLPSIGADFGGAVTVGVAFLVLALLAADWRFNWRLVGLVVAGGLAAALAALAWDYSRGPENWTHLGGFADLVINGGAWPVVLRKADMALRLSIGPGLALVAGWLVALRLRRRGWLDGLDSPAWRDWPLLRPLIAALVTGLALGSAINDSGLVVAITGLSLAGPLMAGPLGELTWAARRSAVAGQTDQPAPGAA